MYSLAENGRKLRELRGNVPRQKVAVAIGISESALAMYELGERNPRDDIKIALAAYYKKSVGELFFNEGQQAHPEGQACPQSHILKIFFAALL